MSIAQRERALSTMAQMPTYQNQDEVRLEDITVIQERHIFTILVSLMLGLSGPAKSPEMIILGRIAIGISASTVGTGITVTYIAEVAPRHLRGQFGAMMPIGINLGALLSNVLGLHQVFGCERLWSLLLTLTCLPSLIFVPLARVLPESPRQLFIENKNAEAAASTIRKLRGVNDVTREMKALENEAERSLWKRQMTVLQLIRSPDLRRQTVCAIVLASANQLCGINIVTFNTSRIFQKARLSSTAVPYCSIGVWGAMLLLSFAVSFSIERFGRRKSLMAGSGTMCFSLVLLTISIEGQNLSTAWAYVSVVATIGYFVGFAIGPSVTLATVAECFDQTARSAAMTLASVVLWVCFMTVVLSTPYTMEAMGGYLFLLPAAFSLAMVIWIFVFLPETKNRSFIDIQNSFHRQEYGPGPSMRRRENSTAPLPM